MPAQSPHLSSTFQAHNVIIRDRPPPPLRCSRSLQGVRWTLTKCCVVTFPEGPVTAGKAPASSNRKHGVTRGSRLQFASRLLQTLTLNMRNRGQTRGLCEGALQRPQRNTGCRRHFAHRQPFGQRIHRCGRCDLDNRSMWIALHDASKRIRHLGRFRVLLVVGNAAIPIVACRGDNGGSLEASTEPPYLAALDVRHCPRIETLLDAYPSRIFDFRKNRWQYDRL